MVTTQRCIGCDEPIAASTITGLTGGWLLWPQANVTDDYRHHLALCSGCAGDVCGEFVQLFWMNYQFDAKGRSTRYG